MTAWDSIAAHEQGLNALADVFQKGRRKLNTEPIRIPFRHGILHGWEMAYDTEFVAAKSWAALVAIRDWALKTERGENEQPEAKPEGSLLDVIRQLHDTEETKNRIAAWAPRSLKIGIDVPATGESTEYAEGSPERFLVEFLHLWRVCNYGFMAKHFDLPFSSLGKVSPAEVREVYEDQRLSAFHLQEIRDEAPSVTEIDVDIDVEGQSAPRLRTFRLVYSHSDKAVVRGDPGGQWGIVNWRFI